MTNQFIPSRCRRDDPQDVPAYPPETDIFFQTLVYPTPSELTDFTFTPGVNPYTIVNDGIYVVASGIALKGSTAGAYRDTRLIIAGSPVNPNHGNFDSKAPNGNFHTAHNLYAEMELLAGWKIGVQIFQNSGVLLTVDVFPTDSPWLTLRRIR